MRMAEQALELMRPLLRSQLFRSTSTLVAYSVVGYLASIAAGPVLTRLYTPADFGLYGTFMVFPLTCTVFAALNFDSVAPAPPQEMEAANVAFGSALVASAMSPILTLLYLIFVWNNLLGYGALPAWSAWLFLIIVLMSSFVSTTQYWCLRNRRFNAIGRGTVLTNVGRAVSQMGLAVTGLGWLPLVLGELVGRIINFFAYLFVSRGDVRRLAPQTNFGEILGALWRYRRFAVVLLPPMVFDAVLSTVALPAVGALYGLAAAGQYYLMKRLIDLPAALISRTVSDAFYSRISEHARESPERIRPLLVRTFSLIAGTAAVGLSPVLLFGPTLFSFVFGQPWRQAGLLAAIMVPGLIVSLGASPVARVFAITQMPALRYVFTLANLIGVASTLAIAWTIHLDLVQTVIGLSLSQFVAYSLYFGTAYLAAGNVHTN